MLVFQKSESSDNGRIMHENGVSRAGVPKGSLGKNLVKSVIEPKINTIGSADPTVGVLMLAFWRHPCGPGRV
jgi:hypothetical protein